MRLVVRMLVLLVSAGWLTGCGPAPEATFVYSPQTSELMPAARKAVEKAVADCFGTPQQLVGWQRLPIDYGAGDTIAEADAAAAAETNSAAMESARKAGRDAALVVRTSAAPGVKGREPGWRLHDGRNLYMRHCLHCHGVSGDGDGPTAKYLNPRPRDYRLGIFKFTSTLPTLKANRADLKRTLTEGVPGTSMPSFVLLADDEIDLLVDYVRWLAMRGEYEKRLNAELSNDYSNKAVANRKKDGEKIEDITKELEENYLVLNDKKKLVGLKPEFLNDVGENLAGEWAKAEEPENVIVPSISRPTVSATDPTPHPESVARGRDLFMSAKAKCFTCHGVGGKGDGTSTVDYWGVPNSTPERKWKERGLHDDWGNAQQPRNLTIGVYRGGRRPIDLYRRVYAGIKGTQMAAFGKTVLNDNEMWDVVNYVLAVPYQVETPPVKLPVLQAGQ